MLDVCSDISERERAQEALGRLNRELRAVSDDAAVVRTIVTLARSLGLAVIAEGVETEAQRRFLERLGRPTYQGSCSARPIGWNDPNRLPAFGAARTGFLKNWQADASGE